MTDREQADLMLAAAQVQVYRRNVKALDEAQKRDREQIESLTKLVQGLQQSHTMQSQQIARLEQQVAMLVASGYGRGRTT